MEQNPPQAEYKPNIYPIMYWAILYGVIAALVLLAVTMLANFITFIWVPIFLAGMVWGGYRKYKQDKAVWMQNQGAVPTTNKSAVQEFKDAARDITQASREMIVRNAQEDAAALRQAQGKLAQAVAEEETIQQEIAQEAQSQGTPVPGELSVQPVAPTEEEIVTEESEETPQTPQSPLQPLV